MKIYQIDAFTDNVFSGNPAAVCPLDVWLSDDVLQKIAMENNLAETAFYVKKEEIYEIRWFTPTIEVDLCGHATLAAAFVIFTFEDTKSKLINFYSHRSGKLPVKKEGKFINLNFPCDTFEKVKLTEELKECFDIQIIEAFKGQHDYLLICENENAIQNCTADLNQISKLNSRAIMITAQGNEVDFVSRFFAPQSGINEDSVTGSAHTTLTPYWSKKLGKKELIAKQLSSRQGNLKCSDLESRIEISGQCKLYLIGEIFIH